MSKLGPHARAVFRVARDGDDPSALDQQRVRAKLAARLATGALVGTAVGTSLATGTASAAVKASIGGAFWIKLLATVVVGGAAVGGTYGVIRSEPAAALAATANAAGQERFLAIVPSIAAAPAEHAPVAAEAAPAPAEALALAPAELPSQPVPAPEAASLRRRGVGSSAVPDRPVAQAPSAIDAHASSVGGAPKSGPTPAGAKAPEVADSLAAETALVGEAQAELRRGRPDAALRALGRHDERFRDGALREERSAARILALCQVGRVDEARAEAARFLRESPRSPLAGQVRASCAGR